MSKSLNKNQLSYTMNEKNINQSFEVESKFQQTSRNWNRDRTKRSVKIAQLLDLEKMRSKESSQEIPPENDYRQLLSTPTPLNKNDSGKQADESGEKIRNNWTQNQQEEDFLNSEIKHKKKNMFDEIRGLSLFENEGPKIDPKGHIVRHSLVGKPQEYYRVKKQVDDMSKLNYDTDNRSKESQIKTKNIVKTKPTQFQIQSYKERFGSNQRDTSASYSNHNTHHMKSSSMNERDTSQAFYDSTNYLNESMNGNSRPVNEQNVSFLRGEEIAQEIFEIQNKLQATQMEKSKYNQKVMRRLTFGDRFQLTQEQRAMTRFDRTQQEWQSFMNQTAQQINRSPDDSIFRSGETYRTKVQYAEVLEHNEDDAKKYGDQLWMMSLRNDDKHKMPELRVYGDFPAAFGNTRMINPKKKDFEVISQPSFSTAKSRFQSSNPFQTFQSRVYMREVAKSAQTNNEANIDDTTAADYMDISNQIQKIDHQQQDHLEVQGRNKFQQESMCIIKNFEHNTLYKKSLINFYNDTESENKNNKNDKDHYEQSFDYTTMPNEEIIERKFDKKDLRKTNNLFFTNLKYKY